MFGTNEVAKRRKAADGFLLHSIFYTLQGEGPAAGVPAVFVRFSGCNLRCNFCDTDFAASEQIGALQLVTRIQKLIPHFSNYRIVLTGGEPMLQPLSTLIKLLHSRGIEEKVDIETAGTVWPDNFGEVVDNVRIICSPKTGSVHPNIKLHATAWKYIIKAGQTSEIDGLPIGSTQAGLSIPDQIIFRPPPMAQVYVQPCDEQDRNLNAANAAAAASSAMQYGYRLSMQLHKLVGLP